MLFAGFFKRFFGEKGFSKIQTKDAITVTIPGRSRPFTMASDHSLFEALLEALNAKNEQAVLGIVAIVEQVTMYTNGEVKVEHGQIFYKGELLHNVVAERILQFVAEGVPCDYLIRFLENVMQNPLKSARDELFLFLENGQLPLMTDGRFQAYKWVDANMKDCHTHTFNNAPGQIVKMKRSDCDTRRSKTCSDGLHVCTQNYSKFGQRLMLVAVNPKDVVSVPHDYNNAKMRCCEYEVLEEIKGGVYGERKHAGIVQYKPALTEAERRKGIEVKFTDPDLAYRTTIVNVSEPEPVPVLEEGIIKDEGPKEAVVLGEEQQVYSEDDASEDYADDMQEQFNETEAGHYQVRFVTHIDSGNKISAIKALRAATKLGLKEAKDAIELPSRTFITEISKEVADEIKAEMKRENINVRVELMKAFVVKGPKKVAKPKKAAKSKAVKVSKPKEEKPVMDDATWTKFKQAVKNKKSVKGFGLSDEDVKTYREKARKELNNG